METVHERAHERRSVAGTHEGLHHEHESKSGLYRNERQRADQGDSDVCQDGPTQNDEPWVPLRIDDIW